MLATVVIAIVQPSALPTTRACAKRRSLLEKSVVGAGAFTHEAGIHVDGLLKHPDNYQGFDPSEVGQAHRIVLGKHSGSRAVQVVYAGLGIELGEAEAQAMLPCVRNFVARHKHPPEIADLHSLLSAIRSPIHV